VLGLSHPGAFGQPVLLRDIRRVGMMVGFVGGFTQRNRNAIGQPK
jgi:hypothetical protein